MHNPLGLGFRLLPSLACLLSLVGCDAGSPEVIELTAEEGVSGSVVFSWDAGTMHMLTVTRCTSECNGCREDGTLDYGASEMVWEAAESPPGEEPKLSSPMTYGDSTELAGPLPQPLISGETYGVEVWLGEDCAEGGCAIALQGCTEFVAP